MTCRRRINSAQLHKDLVKSRPENAHAMANNAEETEPFPHTNRSKTPQDKPDGEAEDTITAEP